MTEKTRAHVETLTAVVRVLMIDKRQVTLSVARQLDEVKLIELDAIFGRIRMNDRQMVIGEHSGDLVTAQYSDPVSVYVDAEVITGTILCHRAQLFDDRHERSRLREHVRLRLPDGGTVMVDRDATELCQCRADGWHSTEQQLAELITYADDWRRPHRAAAEAPLIVLAGLK